MDKLQRPRGLIRYASEESLAGGKTRIIRPRTIAYAVAGLLGIGVVALFVRRYEPFEANVIRAGGVPFAMDGDTLRAPVAVHLVNKQADATTVHLRIVDARAGVVVRVPVPDVTLEPFEGRTVPVLIELPRTAWMPGMRVHLQVRDDASGRERRLDIEVLGPHRSGP
jgi:polyferredoxin